MADSDGANNGLASFVVSTNGLAGLGTAGGLACFDDSANGLVGFDSAVDGVATD